MILLVGVFAGLAAGLIYCLIRRQPYRVPEVRWPWLVFVAFLPQLLAFIVPATRNNFPDNWIPFVLVGSQALLMVWVFANLKKPGFWILGLGLTLNFLVIVLNGGMMPIRPELVQQMIPDAPSGYWEVGERLGIGKDIVLQVEHTRLWFLSDWFTLPKWMNYPLAFSIGDVFITAGAYWLLLVSATDQAVALEDQNEQKVSG